MGPLRVMHIIARMNVGGPAVEIAALMRGLDPSIFEQQLVSGWCASDESDYLQTHAPDIPVHRVQGLGRSVRPTDDALVLARIAKQIRAFQPDIVHTHTAKAGLLGRLAAKASGVRPRIVHTFHGHLLYGYFGTAKTRALIHAERLLARVTDLNIAVGRQVRDDLLRAGIGTSSRFTVIYSGVQLDPLPDRATAEELLGIEPGAIVLAYMGRITGIKRPDRLLEVIRIVHRQRSNIVFVIAGSGDQSVDLTDALHREGLPVLLLGWRSDIETLLAVTDIMVLTSDNEGTPLSLVEAAMAGIPSVATNVGSVSEVVIDGESGLLTSTSASSLADACLQLIDAPSERQRLGEAARAHAEATFSSDQFLDRHAQTYLALRAKARHPDA